jgi:hypothetical protein
MPSLIGPIGRIRRIRPINDGIGRGVSERGAKLGQDELLGWIFGRFSGLDRG